MKNTFKQAGYYSLGLHIFLLLIVSGLSIFSFSVPEPKPFIFSLVPAEELEQGESLATPLVEETYAIKAPEMPQSKLPDLPDLEELSKTAIKSPTSSKKEVKPSAKVTKPPPKPSPKKISYEEFVKTKSPQKETPKKNQSSKKPQKTTKLNTEAIKKDFKDALTPGGASSSQKGEGKKVASGPEVDSSALAAFNAALRSKIDAVWIKPKMEAVGPLIIVVEFYVAPNGALSAVKIVKGSGNSAADRSVLEAFTRLGNAGKPPHTEGAMYRLSFRIGEI